jgi:hypothetical protein
MLDHSNRALLRAGAAPVATTSMRAGHRLRLDLRSGSEWLTFYTGEFDDERIVAAASLAEPGSLVVDVGANIGFWSVPLARRGAAVGARVIAASRWRATPAGCRRTWTSTTSRTPPRSSSSPCPTCQGKP